MKAEIMAAEPGRDAAPSTDAENLTDIDRRSFFGTSSSVLMTCGLVASYGTLFFFAGRFLYPSRDNTIWLFVSDAEGLSPGESLPFTSPAGVRVTVTRRADSPTDQPPDEGSFLALSSVCPHLGCRVHWEPQNDRFFCPCHNGVFDPDGQPVSGPPAAAGQALPRYPLKVVDGGLYIAMPMESVAGAV